MNSNTLIRDLFNEKLNREVILNLELLYFDLIHHTKYSQINPLTIVLTIFKQLKENNYIQSLIKINFDELNNNFVDLNNKKIVILKKSIRKELRLISISFYEDLKKKNISENLILNERSSSFFSFIKNYLKEDKSITHLAGGLESFSFYHNIPNYFNKYRIKNIDINLQTIEKIKYFINHLNIDNYDNLGLSSLDDKPLSNKKRTNLPIEQISFDISLLFGINNKESIYSILLNYYLNDNKISSLELLSKFSSNYIFALKLFDLIDKKIRFDICEFLLINLNYDFFVLSFSTKTLTGKKMNVKRKEVWLENMCIRLKLNYDFLKQRTNYFMLLRNK